MNRRIRMLNGVYIMYHDINWFNWTEKRWVRYDNLIGKTPKKRWKFKSTRHVRE